MKIKPDRSDYEIWFTDWLDGRLNREQAEVFFAFLKQNPDLYEELNDLKLIHLEPPEITYSRKETLRRSILDLNDEQFDNLCIASLENDLTTREQEELDFIVSLDENKRKNYELIKKLKLRPATVIFSGKESVKKLTAGHRIFNYSLAGLGTAATLALFITFYLFFKSARMEKMLSTSLAADTLLIELSAGLSAITDQAVVEKSSPIHAAYSKMPEKENATGGILSDNELKEVNTESTDIINVIIRERPPDLLVVKMPEISVYGLNSGKFLLRQFNPSNAVPDYQDQRSNVDRFLAKIFHEIIMNDTMSGNRPVKSYDLAIAGITGINKLLGWEMALEKKVDKNGEIRSYYFSSRILKINTPAKKPINEL